MFSKKYRIKNALIIGSFFAAGALSAQTTSSVRIFTNPPGLQFSVDGQNYEQPVTLLWPQGSKHVIQVPNVQTLGVTQNTAQYALGAVISNIGPILNLSNVTADPDLTFIELPFTIAYSVNLNFFACPANLAVQTKNCTEPLNCQPGTVCPEPGFVILNGTTYYANGGVYIGAGSQAVAEAHPNPGWVFSGWLPVPGTGDVSQAFQNIWTVNGPMILYPQFTQAVPVSVTVQTVPAGLQILADRTNYFAPVNLEWGLGSVHQLGAISPQYDLHGNLWVFSSWSDNGAYSHTYTVPSTGQSAVTVTASYTTGTLVTFATTPAGLALTVDGRQNYPDYTFAWVPGSIHTVTAPASQVDANGNTWVFQSWSNAGPATQQITVSGVATNNRYTAVYAPGGTVNINSNPAGVPVQVDGQSCPTPCTVGRSVGTSLQVAAPATASAGQPGTELNFHGWSDGGPATRSVTVAAQPTNLAAAYKMRYQLQAVSDPPNGAVWKITPASPDSYFDPNTRIEVSVSTKPGFEFLNWAGDASGSYPSALVVMSAPQTIRAELNPVPYINPGGIMNSAADAAGKVAPGSVVSIYGINLASGNFTSPSARLATTLDSVTVRAGGQAVPLFFVSTGQINVQLPSNLSVGDHTLTVHIDGKPDATAELTVSRNAPGLYGTVVNNATFAVANHQDGSAISVSSPARRGEVVSLFGTGFGPYATEPPDGVPVPAGTKYALADSAKILIGEQQMEPVWAGAAAGRVGVGVVQLKIDESIPHASNVALKLAVNQAVSNSVLLSVE